MHVTADIVIFGGGVAGLWLLDSLRREGHRALLLECHPIGSGQTGHAQGILHSGIKYLFQQGSSQTPEGFGSVTEVWRNALLGRCEPDLRQVSIRSQQCYLWRTDSVSSILSMKLAVHALKTRPELIAPDERPVALRNCPGQVWRLDEQVINPTSLLSVLSERNRGHVWHTSHQITPEFQFGAKGEVKSVAVTDSHQQRRAEISASQFVFAAGAGNAALRACARLPANVMQRRPLHMTMVVGNLPELNGHCLDGASTRVTISSERCPDGRVSWQLGGQLAETGVGDSSDTLIERAQNELATVLPGVSFANCRWSTHRIDRAEAKSFLGAMPTGPQVRLEKNVFTVWPTKMVLAPQLANMLVTQIGSPANSEATFSERLRVLQWPAPPVASPLWKDAEGWRCAA
jgi:glycine/D-amino acid oxidase-like deaminating enzyme